jgi:lipopolysaccharide/colanic/teichoic acid biosynthesis glycosyltransferase
MQIVEHARAQDSNPGILSIEVSIPAPGSRSLAAQRRLKRAIDVAVSTIAVALLAPAMAAIAILIRRDSPGPAVFRQIRLGRGGKPFVFYKFRTMQADNDPTIHRQFVTRMIDGAPEDELRGVNGCLKIEADPRVTRFGALLRRTSIDELPQLFNVLKGDMSLVGPRPPLPYEVEEYQPRHLRRLACLPGITGLWQVSGRTKTTFEDMVRLDAAYMEEWSIWLDMKILWRTIFVVLSREGAW